MSGTDRFLDAEQIRQAIGGRWHGGRDAPPWTTGVSIDSRTIRPGEAFFAIRGDRTDGHRYLNEAVRRGAAMLIVSDEAALPHPFPDTQGDWPRVLVVPDTSRALGRLARSWRDQLGQTRVIAVTGSNGKTTTVRMIEAVLSSALRGSASPGSYNNHIGLPLTILSARAGDRFLVCEVGSSAPGEIDRLGAIARPDAAVITGVGGAHLEGFGSIEGVAREKTSLLGHLRPGGLAVVHEGVPGLDRSSAGGTRLVRFGRSDAADLRLSNVRGDADGVRFDAIGLPDLFVPLLGEHNASNALAAVAIGRWMGLTDDQIRAGLGAVRRVAMRLEPAQVAGLTLVNDAYNANPDSTLAALATIGQIAAATRPQRVVLVLGDLLELGEATRSGHKRVIDAIGGMDRVDLLVAVGANFAGAADRLGWDRTRIQRLDDLGDGRARSVAGMLRPGDLVLLKGSRAMGLERIADALAERARAGPGGRAPAGEPVAPR